MERECGQGPRELPREPDATKLGHHEFTEEQVGRTQSKSSEIREDVTSLGAGENQKVESIILSTWRSNSNVSACSGVP